MLSDTLKYFRKTYFVLTARHRMADSDIRAYRTISKRLVRVEERGIMLKNLQANGIGLRDEEEFILRISNKFKSRKRFGKKKEILGIMMKEKLRDNFYWEGKTRSLRNHFLWKIEKTLGRNSRPCRSIREEVKITCKKLRRKLKEKYGDKVNFLVNKYKEDKPSIDELSEEDRNRYEEARIFWEDERKQLSLAGKKRRVGKLTSKTGKKSKKSEGSTLSLAVRDGLETQFLPGENSPQTRNYLTSTSLPLPSQLL